MNAKTQSSGEGVNPFPSAAGEARPGSTQFHGATTRRSTCQVFGFLVLVCGLLIPPPLASNGAESYNTIVREHLALEVKAPIDSAHAEDEKAEPPGVADLKRAVAARTEVLTQGQPIPLPPPSNQVSTQVAIALPIVALIVVGLVIYQFKRRFNTLFPTFDRSEEFAKSVVLEDPTINIFFRELRDGLKGGGEAKLAVAADAATETATTAAAVKDLFVYLPEQLALLRNLCSEVSQATEKSAREGRLLDGLRYATELKDVLKPTELRPAWLLACAVAGLFKQISKNVPEVTDSVMKTLSEALDLLGQLCIRGLNPNLASEPPVRLLAVDDDAVSRLAVSFALKQAFDKPDLAPDGASALEMITQRTYDVIFLDVDMPSMDGYQVCKQIHQTENHRTTPVVFVTGHNDYQSRTMSRLSGGESHIAKPFLTFEITVKALTLVLRARLGQRATETNPAVPDTAAVPAPAPPVTAVAVAAAPEPEKLLPETSDPDEPESLPLPAISPLLDEFISSALIKATGEKTAQAFATHSPAYVAALRNQLNLARETTEVADQQKFLGRLLVGLRLLNSEADRVERRTVCRVCSTLERMLKKLLKQDELCGPSMLNAAAHALDLIEELATHPMPDPNLTSQPINILVVDDDPVARRALSMAVQMAFGRPEQAESGEAALALAAQKPFDLIFLDVLMPGMDGFDSCLKIHETAHNRQTPAVFVTGKNDSLSLSQATLAGGAGFISKPVLPTQITLTAMTFVLRNRLNAASTIQSN